MAQWTSTRRGRLLLLALAAACVGPALRCGPPAPGDGAGGSDTDGQTAGEVTSPGSGDPFAGGSPLPEAPLDGTSRLSWQDGRAPQWPEGWRLMGEGQFGGEDRPAGWLRFETPGEDVNVLARQALEALEPLAGEVRLRDVAVDTSGQHAVGQLDGKFLTAAVDVSATGSRCAVSITLQTRPGLLEPARRRNP